MIVSAKSVPSSDCLCVCHKGYMHCDQKCCAQPGFLYEEMFGFEKSSEEDFYINSPVINDDMTSDQATLLRERDARSSFEIWNECRSRSL